MNKIYLIILMTLLVACGAKPINNNQIASEGVVKNYLCSRGCNQWVIIVEDKSGTQFYIDTSTNITVADYKIDNQKIKFKAERKNQKISIKMPSENDVPKHDFYAELIELKSVQNIN